jgi:transketolase
MCMEFTFPIDRLNHLKQKANQARQLVIEMLKEAGSGHSAGSLGMADIFTALYFQVLNHDPKNPSWEDRDRLILSNGHICPIQYATMAMAGYFDIEELKTLRKLGSRLQGHPHRCSLPGIETTSGPLGEGLSQGIGMALAAKLNNKNYQVYVITSDGEHQEGNIWEAVMLAAKYKLNNLTLIIDRNNIQISGNTESVLPLNPLRDKYFAFNWDVVNIYGNNILDFAYAVKIAKENIDKPTVIIAKTVPGKGVSFMENNYLWHGKAPNEEEANKALEELKNAK